MRPPLSAAWGWSHRRPESHTDRTRAISYHVSGGPEGKAAGGGGAFWGKGSKCQGPGQVHSRVQGVRGTEPEGDTSASGPCKEFGLKKN